MQVVAPPRHVLAFANGLHSRMFLGLRETLDPVSMTTELSTTSVRVLLEKARDEFMRLRREASASHIDADGDCDGDGDGDGDHTAIEVVIARNVTSEDYGSIGEDSLHRLVVELHEDGTLVLVDVLSNEYRSVVITLATAAANYVDANEAAVFSIGDEGRQQGANAGGAGGDGTRNPDVVISQGILMQPRVMFTVGVETGCPTMINRAAHYFRTNPSLLLVVGVLFYQRRKNIAEVKIPAMAMAFGRGDLAASGLIRVLDARSFGNADVHTNALRILEFPALNNPPLPLEPFVGVAGVNQYTSTGILRRASLMTDVHGWNQLERQQPMVVPVPGGLPPLVLPLYQIFRNAMDGWNQDAAR